MRHYKHYHTYQKPSWAPPAAIFGPVWTVLYLLMAISFGEAGYLFFTEQIPGLVAFPFLLNLVFNLGFTPIQFGLVNFKLASLDILLTLATLIWAMVAIYPFAAWIALINIPYFVWLCFATALQLTLTVMNPRV